MKSITSLSFLLTTTIIAIEGHLNYGGYYTRGYSPVYDFQRSGMLWLHNYIEFENFSDFNYPRVRALNYPQSIDTRVDPAQ